MDREFEDRLKLQYPQLLANLHGDLMQVPLGRGIECRNGWFGIVDQLCSSLMDELGENPDPKFVLEQVKQKFGILRVYSTQTENARILNLIDDAVQTSKHTCEECGNNQGKLGYDLGPMQTLCASCVEVLTARGRK